MIGIGSLVLLVLLGSCNRNAVAERAEEIRARNAKLDQVSKAQVYKELRTHWSVRGGAWFGKLPDGSVLRLDAPTVTVTPITDGKPFCCTWMGEVTLQANHWEHRPAPTPLRPFAMKYLALLETGGHYGVAAADGKEIVPANENEIGAFSKPP